MAYTLKVVEIYHFQFSIQLRHPTTGETVWITQSSALDLAETLERVVNTTNFLTKLPGT